MKKNTLLLLAMVTSAGILHAQTPNIVSEPWNEKPVLTVLDPKYSKESAVILLDTRRVEFIDDKDNNLAEYYTLHKAVHINDDRGIEEFNKIYLEFTDNSDLVDVKARTILPGGKVVNLDKNNIKDITEENGNSYKIFALDGLQKGCDVEYSYTFKRPPSYFGRDIIQSTFPVLHGKLEIVAPTRLRFTLKAYNTQQQAVDTVLNDKRFSDFELNNVPGLEEEKYATYEDNLQRVEFKLSYNDQTRKGERLFTWNELARRVFAIYTDVNEKETAKVAELVNENGWAKLPDEASKITAIENYVKKKFGYDEHLDSEDGNLLTTVLKNKIAGTIGTLRLYSAIFQNLGVNYQFVLTSDRSKARIDRTFENWNNCDYTLFFFPAENEFMAPSRPDYRAPWILPSWAGGNGLFCKRTTLGSVSTAIAEIKPIPFQDYTKSIQNLETRLEFTPSLDSVTVDAKHSFAGYPSIGYRDAFTFANDEEKKKLIKELAKIVSDSEDLLSSNIENNDFENETTNVPLILHVKTRTGEMVERAGNKLLVKIGLAIGPQVEMYQEKVRQLPVDMDFAHVEERRIEFVIPDGYTISNLNDLKIAETYKENGELTMGFVTDYTLNGKILSIHIMEEYRRFSYPLSQFEQFKKVINASSDFNKVVLVLEKKG